MVSRVGLMVDEGQDQYALSVKLTWDWRELAWQKPSSCLAARLRGVAGRVAQ